MIYDPVTEEFIPTEAGETCLTADCGGIVTELSQSILREDGIVSIDILLCNNCEVIWNVKSASEADYLQDYSKHEQY